MYLQYVLHELWWTQGGHDLGMFLVKVFMFFAEASRKQTFHAEALKDPEPICMEDRIMKNGSPILKCHMYVPSVKFEIWMYYFDIVCVFDSPASTTKNIVRMPCPPTNTNNTLPRNP